MKIDAWLRQYATLRNGMKSAQQKPLSPPADWGTTYPFEGYLDFRFQIWLESKFQVWPRLGGIDEQDADLVDDFQTLLLAYQYQEQDVVSKAKPNG